MTSPSGMSSSGRASWSQLAGLTWRESRSARRRLLLYMSAISLGVFGVPTLIVDQELFWGADAMDFVDGWLADPGIVMTPEMLRAVTLPVGVSRKRP